MPDDSGGLVVTNARAFYTPRAAAGALGIRHSPRPHEGGKFTHDPGAIRAAGLQSRILIFSVCPVLRGEANRNPRASCLKIGPARTTSCEIRWCGELDAPSPIM